MTVERIVDEHGVGLHILDMRIALDPNDSVYLHTRVLDGGYDVCRVGG
ncbi:hypothetical protein [Halocatena pleomorpha]|nr:hypothetical protein [Halocatena pleomorpha]